MTCRPTGEAGYAVELLKARARRTLPNGEADVYAASLCAATEAGPGLRGSGWEQERGNEAGADGPEIGTLNLENLDAETGLEKKISVNGRGPDGSPMLNVTEFSDYRSVDGGMVPFVLKQRQNGTIIATTTLDKVEFNVSIEDGLFKMPAK